MKLRRLTVVRSESPDDRHNDSTTWQLRPQLRPASRLIDPTVRIGAAFTLLRPAEAEGFEPPDPCGSSAFKADAFGRSATLPWWSAYRRLLRWWGGGHSRVPLGCWG